MNTGTRKNSKLKSIMKSNEDLEVSTGEVEEDSFADESTNSANDESGSGSEERTDSSPRTPAKRKPNALAIAGRETMYVLCSKTMAYLVLLLSAIACGVVTFFYIQDEEIDTFKKEVCLAKAF